MTNDRLRRGSRAALLALAAGATPLLTGCAPTTSATAWTAEDERAHAARREDPATWDTKLFEDDAPLLQLPRFRPMAFGVYPNPDYDLAPGGDFAGIGSRPSFTGIDDAYLIGQAFFIGKSERNQAELGGDDDRVFAHIVVLADKLPTDAGANAGSIIISRNHPHTLAHGFLDTAAAPIDYIAFQTAAGDAYAIVSSRLFDLTAGNCILIVPQPDGTLRSMQIDAPPMPSADVNDYHAKLAQRPDVRALLETGAALNN